MSDLMTGITALLTMQNLLLLVGGVLIGMIVGVIPGVGPSAGLAILLPVTFGLDPTGAIVMLAAVYYGAMYGGTITSVLINTPGESATVASTFDGYPLAKQGRAGPALVMAAVGSFVAGTIGAILLSVAAPATAAFAKTFGPPEYFLIVMAGLLTVIVILRGNKLLGALSALIGFAIGTVGVDIGGGERRYTFGAVELINGVDFIPVAIGLFAVGEVLHTLWRGGHLEQLDFFGVSARSRGFWPNRKDFRESVGPTLRGSFLGFGVGLTPGAGATVASLMAYNVEKSVSRTPEKFGKGAMPGLVGPESANNAASSGAMVPLLTLGIPGGGATAVLLGGFLMWGLQPGPLLMEQNPEFAWGLIASMYLGNVMLLAVNIFCIPAFASIARVPFRLLGPIIVLLCALGTFAVNKSLLDVQIMLACGVLGFFMRRYGLSPAALVIALVLGPLAEESLRQTLLISGGNPNVFVERGTSVAILIFIAFLLTLPLLKKPIARASKGCAAAGFGSPARRNVRRARRVHGRGHSPSRPAPEPTGNTWDERRRSATHRRRGRGGRGYRDAAAPARRPAARRDDRRRGRQHRHHVGVRHRSRRPLGRVRLHGLAARHERQPRDAEPTRGRLCADRRDGCRLPDLRAGGGLAAVAVHLDRLADRAAGHRAGRHRSDGRVLGRAPVPMFRSC